MKKDKEKDKKHKDRYLSPSFRKGAVKEKKEEDEGGFKINLIAAENDDDEDTKSPSPNKHKKNKKKKKKKNQILQQLKMIQKKNQNIEDPHIQFQMNVK